MSLSLEEEVIVVIGGTSGLGLSAAQAYLRAGAAGVVVTGLSPESVAAAGALLGERAAALAGDAISGDHAVQAIGLALEKFGRFDALYHVAGGSGRKFGDGRLHEVTDAGIDYTLSLNLSALIRSNRAAVQQFLRQNTGGAILNMGSVLGWQPSPQFFATHVYAAAKSAVVGFTKSIAASYAARNIRANVIAPGLVDTPMARRAAADEAIQRFIATKQPLDGGRIGQPSDLDGAAVFLLSPAARFITGQTLAVDGGWCVSDGQVPENTAP